MRTTKTILILLGMLATAPAMAATLLVDTVADAIADNGDCSLREAIINANEADQSGSVDCVAGESGLDEIIFDPSTDGSPVTLTRTGAGEDAAATGDLDVTDTLIITGNGREETIIDGDAADRVFHLHNGTEVRIEAVAVRNGANVREGAGILVDGGELALSRVLVSDNLASGGNEAATGGGIFARSGLLGGLLIEKSIVRDNRAETIGDDRLDDADGGGVAVEVFLDGDSTLVIRDSRIVGNEVASINEDVTGAAVRLRQGSSDTARIIRTEISANTATVESGRIFGAAVRANQGTIEMRNTTISGNAGSGGAVNGAALRVRDATLIANNLTIARNSASCNSGDTCVGGYVDEAASVTEELSNSIIANNTAIGGNNWFDCKGDVASLGYNFIGDANGCSFASTTGDQVGDSSGSGAIDPKLDGLAANGAFAHTHRPLAGSPVIDAADPDDPAGTGRCETEDQRGAVRPSDGNDDGIARCTIGAFERAVIFTDRFEPN